MLIRSAPRRLGDRREHAGPVGDVHAHAVEGAGVRVRAVEHAPAVTAASPIQRARNPASPLASAASTCSIRRRCSASAARTAAALSRRMSTQMRGFAPAMRVMSRSEPPALASGSWPSIRAAPAWLTTTLASTCGTWLVIATSRSCAAGSIATGTAPSSATNPWTRRWRSGSVCASASGTRSRRRRSRATRGRRRAPPSRRSDDRRRSGRACRCGDDARLGRADVRHGRPSAVAPSTAATWPGARIGAATTASSAPSARLFQDDAVPSTRRECPRPRAHAGRGPSRATCAPRSSAPRARRRPHQPGADNRDPHGRSWCQRRPEPQLPRQDESPRATSGRQTTCQNCDRFSPGRTSGRVLSGASARPGCCRPWLDFSYCFFLSGPMMNTDRTVTVSLAFGWIMS